MPRASAHSRSAESSGIVQQAAARSSAPEPQPKSFASAPSSRPIDARHPGESRRQRRAICSTAGFGSQPPAGSAAAWPSGELSLPICQSYLRFYREVSSFSELSSFLHIEMFLYMPRECALCRASLICLLEPSLNVSCHLFMKSCLPLTPNLANDDGYGFLMNPWYHHHGICT